MRRFLAVLIGVILGGAFVYGAFEYHLVRTADGFVLISKQQPTLTDAYADIRQWKPAEWRDHAALVQNLSAGGRGDLVTDSLADGLLDGVFAPLLEKAHSLKPGEEPADAKQRWWNQSAD